MKTLIKRNARIITIFLVESGVLLGPYVRCKWQCDTNYNLLHGSLGRWTKNINGAKTLLSVGVAMKAVNDCS